MVIEVTGSENRIQHLFSGEGSVIFSTLMHCMGSALDATQSAVAHAWLEAQKCHFRPLKDGTKTSLEKAYLLFTCKSNSLVTAASSAI